MPCPTAWTVSRSFPESAPEYDDRTWHRAAQPQPLATFGHGQGRAWYRARFTVTDAGPQSITFSGVADRYLAWVDGRYLGVRGAGSRLGHHLLR